MFATIEVSPHILIQGEIARRLPSGMVVIRVRDDEYVGAPLASQRRKPMLAVVAAGF
jgi:hypothetical protein